MSKPDRLGELTGDSKNVDRHGRKFATESISFGLQGSICGKFYLLNPTDSSPFFQERICDRRRTRKEVISIIGAVVWAEVLSDQIDKRRTAGILSDPLFSAIPSTL